MTDRRNWAETHQRGWEAALATLRESGWQARMTCLAAPVQIEGVLPCGEHFYFRSRHDETLLAVGGEDPSDGAPWERQASYGPQGQEKASYLAAQPGLRLLLSLADLHRSSCQRRGGNPDG